MKLLLDTHALLWWLSDSPKLCDKWRKALAAPNNEVFVSAASIWEVAIKQSLGKLHLPEGLDISTLHELCGFKELSLSARHVAQVAHLPWHHRDPFDRALVAQAQVEDLVLVSNDKKMKSYDLQLL